MWGDESRGKTNGCDVRRQRESILIFHPWLNAVLKFEKEGRMRGG